MTGKNDRVTRSQSANSGISSGSEVRGFDETNGNQDGDGVPLQTLAGSSDASRGGATSLPNDVGNDGIGCAGNIGSGPTDGVSASVDMQALLVAAMELLRNREREPARTFHVMPDLSKSVEDFSGAHGPDAAKAWLDGLLKTATTHQWPDEFKLDSARVHLVGGAKEWYLARADRINSWSDFERQFRRTFAREATLTERFERMRARVQMRGEPTSSYFHSKMRLCRDLGFDFEHSKEQVLEGLWEKSQCESLLAKVHVDEDELFEDLEKYERVAKSRRERQRGDRTMVAASKTPAIAVPMEKRPVSSSVRRCYNCQGSGHLASSCSAPKAQRTLKCFSCGIEGHVKKDCPSRLPGSSHAVVSKLSEAQEEKRSDSLVKYLREVVVADQHLLRGMIDTGSAVCTLKESAARKLGLPVTYTSRTLHGFGGGRPVECGALLRTSLAVDGVVAEGVELLVVPDSAQTIDVLVGRTYTDLPHLAYARVGDILKFGYANAEPFRDLQVDAPACRYQLTAAENVTLRSNSMIFLSVVVDGGRSADIAVPLLNLYNHG